MTRIGARIAGGRFELLHASVDRAKAEVSIEFRDPHAEGGPALRRWVYGMAGKDSYHERLYGPRGEGWELLADFALRRDA